MTALTPNQAVNIAKSVYEVRNQSLNDAWESTKGLGIDGLFELESAQRIQGASGPAIINKRSGFGYAAKGVGNRKDEALIALRGTNILRDAWTDANIGIQKGPNGWPVHAGFNNTFKSIKPELDRFFSRHNPTHVHCVGHSLGGGVATLVADYLTEIRGRGGVSLYTFGCPRVGGNGFTRQLTVKVQADNIYRVYHAADVVSMLPIFPMLHAPNPGTDIPIGWSGCPISVLAHLTKNYAASIGDAGWAGLKRQAQLIGGVFGDLKTWLETASIQGDFMYSARLLRMIGRALTWLVDRTAHLVGTNTKVCFTALDRLAWLLNQGALASKELAADITSLMGKIFVFLGRSWVSGAKLTVAFIRWVLNLLSSTARNVAYRALNCVGRD